MAVSVAELTIPDILREAMRRRALSERALAMYLGVSSNAVNRWVRAQSRPDPEYCQRIAEYLGLPLADVLRAAGHPAPPAAADSASDPPWLAQLIAEMRELRLTPAEADVLDATVQGLRALRAEKAQGAGPGQSGPEAPAG